MRRAPRGSGTPVPAQGERGGLFTPAMLAAALAVAVLALYGRTAGFPFLFFDDDRYLLENVNLRAGLTPASAAWAWTTLYFSNWHPLTWLSWLGEVSLFGLSPAAAHLDNALLHAANAALLFAALLRLTGARWPSALAAALFALHPLRVEAVAWASERKELLAATFGLLSLLAYARHVARPSVGRLALVTLAFAASLASKPMWLTLPFLLLLLDRWPLARPPSFRLVAEKLPLLALSAASAAVTMVAQSRGGAVSGIELGFGARAANALVAYVRYLGLTLWPADLSVFVPYPVDGLPAWAVAGAALLLAALSTAAVAWRARAPWLLVGWCWFLGTLVPVIGLVQVGGQAVADRYTYLPGIGLCVAVAWAIALLAHQGSLRRPVFVAVALALTALSAATWRQVGLWSDHATLFRHAIAVDPGNGRAHGILAYGLWREGRREEALDEARLSVELTRGGVNEWGLLGSMFRETGRFEEGRRAYREAVKANPRFAPAWVGLGATEADLGRLAEGIAALREALRLRPDDAPTWRAFGELQAFQGRRDEAAQAFREALRLDPADLDAEGRLRQLTGGAATP